MVLSNVVYVASVFYKADRSLFSLVFIVAHARALLFLCVAADALSWKAERWSAGGSTGVDRCVTQCMPFGSHAHAQFEIRNHACETFKGSEPCLTTERALERNEKAVNSALT